jgi:hypothetical protein
MDFTAFSAIEERLLVARLEATRQSITHAGEKGRALEQSVHSLLRSFLPAEYGLSTGFIVWQGPQGVSMSTQLDVIIYDAVRYGPLIRLETCNVFPLEAVYGYVEVKAVIRSSDAVEAPADSIQACVKTNKELRKMNLRHFVSPVARQHYKKDWLSLRSYVFAFEGAGKAENDLPAFAKDLANAMKKAGTPTHLHGVFIAGRGFLHTRPVNAQVADDDDYHHVKLTSEHALLAFKMALLTGLATFQRAPQDWELDFAGYFDYVPAWQEVTPD